MKAIVCLLCTLFFVGSSLHAAQTQPKSSAPVKKSTQVNFDDMLVQGKFQFSDEAVTTVEGDQVLDALLGVRTDFKDRIIKSSEQF